MGNKIKFKSHKEFYKIISVELKKQSKLFDNINLRNDDNEILKKASELGITLLKSVKLNEVTLSLKIKLDKNEINKVIALNDFVKNLIGWEISILDKFGVSRNALIESDSFYISYKSIYPIISEESNLFYLSTEEEFGILSERDSDCELKNNKWRKLNKIPLSNNIDDLIKTASLLVAYNKKKTDKSIYASFVVLKIYNSSYPVKNKIIRESGLKKLYSVENFYKHNILPYKRIYLNEIGEVVKIKNINAWKE